MRVRSVIRPPQGSNASLEASFMSSEGPEGFFEFPRVGSGEFLSEEGVSQDVWGHMLFPRWVGGGVSRSGLALSQIIWHSRWHPARGDREPKLSLHHLQMRILLTTRAEIPSAWLQGRRIYCDPARLIFCSPSHARCCFLNSGLKTEPLSVRFLVRGFFLSHGLPVRGETLDYRTPAKLCE